MTDTDITIPPAALETALEAFAHASGLGILPDDEYDEEWREDLKNGMRAACLAMLNAWPGMDTGPNIYGRQDAIIHLPLTQENTDAEA